MKKPANVCRLFVALTKSKGFDTIAIMTINELQIQLDIYSDNRIDVLNEKCVKNGKYFLFVDSNDGNCYLFSKDGDQIDILNLEQIETGTFWNCTSLKSIQISDSVESIGNHAFAHCTSLTSIIIPDSVESIGNHAFAHCTSLTSIIIPDSVKSIEDEAFYNCTSLKSVKIPDSVKSIEDGAFDSCRSLKSIQIPDSVKSIGIWVFAGCKSLKEVFFKGKTMAEVKAMKYYPWGIDDMSIIKCC